MRRLSLLLLAALVCLAAQLEAQTMTRTPGTFYVSPKGNDAWSGTLPAPSADGTDGPFATIPQAQKALRATDRNVDRQLVLREGTYYLDTPLQLTAEDSGREGHPLVVRAATGETVVLSGGQPITGWKKGGDGIWRAPVPDAKTGWEFRQLRIGNERQRLARYPNYDPEQPTKGGWLFARSQKDLDSWYTTVANIHGAGDLIRWEVDVPAAGTYRLWLYYGQLMKPHGRDNNNGQMTIRVDDGEEVWLQNLPDTGGWSNCKWSECATIQLPAGKHSLIWTNRKGGGINMNALAMSDDPNWQPEGIELAEPAAGKHRLVVQAQDYVEAKSKELRVDQGSGFKARKDELPFGEGDIPDWDLAGAQIQVFPAWGWVGGKIQIGGIDRANGMLKLTGQNVQQEIRLGNRYYLENVREALDEPGEFYLDRKAGELLLRSDLADLSGSDVVAPRLDRLVHIRGEGENWAEHIQFEGIEFRDALYSIAVDSLYTPDDAAIWVDQARSIEIDRCVFTLLGGYGVKFVNQSEACAVTRCRMFDLGQGGVIARGTDETKPKDCTVAGCEMYDLGRVYQHVGGVYVTCGDGFRVAHCDIRDVPRYAISFKSYGGTRGNSHRCVAEYNDIRRTNLETNDTGAIETLGRDRALTGTIIRYNLILDTIGMKHTPDGKLLSPFYTWGIYLDDYSSGMQIYGNIVARNFRGAYHNHLGFDNIVENNIFVDGHLQQGEWNGRADMRRNTFTNNVVAYSNPEASYLRSGGWDPEVLKACDRNVIWWQGGDLARAEKPTPAGSWEKWQELGFDTHSVLADPLFVDAANDDYRLKPGSPALKLGFKPIPVEKIGTKGYRHGE